MVIGAGVVGLAVARALAMSGREVLILESQQAFGTGTSSRSSEVLHAGLYYAQGSLKARTCVRGRALLLEFARRCGVAHRILGKWVVACESAQEADLARLHRNALDNGVPGLSILDGAQARVREPLLRCSLALESQGSGIIDSHALMLALLGQAQGKGAQIAVCSPVVGGAVRPDGSIELRVGGAEPMRLHARTVVNCAGLTAAALARRIEGIPPDSIPPSHFCKGHYFSLQGRAPFSRLVYPLPDSAGLGIHMTLDLDGRARFGPDVQWLDMPGSAQAAEPANLGLAFEVQEQRRLSFVREIRRYWPGLPDAALRPDYSGVRPKIVGPGQASADFMLSTCAQHGVPGWVAFYGIESPGLTACLALAEEALSAVKAVQMS